MCKFSELTKKEKKHLRITAGCRTLNQFKKTAEFQREQRLRQTFELKPLLEPCWECKFIAKKLGLPV
jgi:hypothetical protein